jgi:hypothetical protein
MSQGIDAPPPGSPEARAKGCVCSPNQNRNGEGVSRPGLGKMFFPVYWCPLHGIKAMQPRVGDDAHRP